MISGAIVEIEHLDAEIEMRSPFKYAPSLSRRLRPFCPPACPFMGITAMELDILALDSIV